MLTGTFFFTRKNKLWFGVNSLKCPRMSIFSRAIFRLLTTHLQLMMSQNVVFNSFCQTFVQILMMSHNVAGVYFLFQISFEVSCGELSRSNFGFFDLRFLGQLFEKCTEFRTDVPECRRGIEFKFFFKTKISWTIIRKMTLNFELMSQNVSEYFFKFVNRKSVEFGATLKISVEKGSLKIVGGKNEIHKCVGALNY